MMKEYSAPATGTFLAELVDSTGRPMSSTVLSDELMEEFVNVARAAGLDAVYVLMDQLDATTEAQQNPGAVSNLVESLIEDRHLISGAGWAFKIFLPEEVRSALFKPNTKIADFVRRHELRIQWDQDSLRELLHSRLEYFSDERYESLEAIASDERLDAVQKASDVQRGDHLLRRSKDAKTVEDDMIIKAEGSPRRLLRFGKYLFEACAMRSKGSEILIWADWNQALARFSEEADLGPMNLHLEAEEQRIFKGHWPIELTAMEYAFLKCLEEHNGRCDRTTLVKKVWGPAAQDDPQVVGQLVKRIREKIEIDRENPVYLTTERGFGYRLNLKGKQGESS